MHVSYRHHFEKEDTNLGLSKTYMYIRKAFGSVYGVKKYHSKSNTLVKQSQRHKYVVT